MPDLRLIETATEATAKAPLHLYVAGPMRGIPDFNFPAFDAHAAALRAAGYVVFNPAERDRDVHGADVNLSETGDLADFEAKGGDLRLALSADMAYISLEADGICVLPGWENSKGALAETALAAALSLPVLPLELWVQQAAAGLDPVQMWNLAKSVMDEFADAALAVDTDGGDLVWSLDDAADTGQVPPPARLGSWMPSAVGETLAVSDTGGAKGAKPWRYDLVPTAFEDQVALLFAAGATKYEDHNWRRGYPLSLSIAAAYRHLGAIKRGEDYDADSTERIGQPVTHAAAVAFHMAVIIEHLAYPQRYGRFDDRYRPDA